MNIRSAKRLQTIGAVTILLSYAIRVAVWLTVGGGGAWAVVTVLGFVAFYSGTWQINRHLPNPYRGGSVACRCHQPR